MSHGGNIAKGDWARGAQSYAEVQHNFAPVLAGGRVGHGGTSESKQSARPWRRWGRRLSLTVGLLLTSCRNDTPALEYDFREPYRTTQVPHHEAWSFELLPRSHVRFRLRSGRQEIRGTVPIVSARLASLGGLEETQGKIVVDLEQIQLLEAEEPESLTEQSLNDYLRSSGGGSQFAVFRIRELGRLSAPHPRDGHAVASTQGEPKSWRIDGSVTGDLTFHGYRLPYTTAVRAVFQGAEAAEEGPLRLVEVATRSSLQLQLDDHGFSSMIASYRSDVPEGSQRRPAPRLEIEAYLFGKSPNTPPQGN